MTPSSLRKWRIDRGLTQKGLSDLLGVDRMTIYRWEKAMREIPPFLELALIGLEKGGPRGRNPQGKESKAKIKPRR